MNILTLHIVIEKNEKNAGNFLYLAFSYMANITKFYLHCRLTVTVVVSVWILRCDVTFNLVNFKQMKVLETSG